MDFWAGKRNQFPVRIEPRILHGCGFPVPALGHRLWLNRSVNYESFRQIQNIDNPIERDFQFKRSLGFPDEVFTRAGDLLRLSR